MFKNRMQYRKLFIIINNLSKQENYFRKKIFCMVALWKIIVKSLDIFWAWILDLSKNVIVPDIILWWWKLSM